ncbi:MAG: endonuclease domain-containing protein [Thermodesulfovibrionales bacterium]
MGLIYNNPALTSKRRQLRQNQTKPEKLLWQKLRNKQLNGIKFFRQYSIGNYIVDFYSPLFKVAIEIDGEDHADQKHRKYDRSRTRYFKTYGIEVIRFWNNEIMENIDGVLERIAEKCNVP